jgi:hypothetical protein
VVEAEEEAEEEKAVHSQCRATLLLLPEALLQAATVLAQQG